MDGFESLVDLQLRDPAELAPTGVAPGKYGADLVPSGAQVAQVQALRAALAQGENLVLGVQVTVCKPPIEPDLGGLQHD